MMIGRLSVGGGGFTTGGKEAKRLPYCLMAATAAGGFLPPSHPLLAMVLFYDGGGGGGRPFYAIGKKYTERESQRWQPRVAVAAARRARPHSRPLTAAAGGGSLPPPRRAATNGVQRRRGVTASTAPRVAGRVAATASPQGHQKTGGSGQRRAS